MTSASETLVSQPIDVEAALAGSRAMGQWLRDMRAHVAAGRDTEAPAAPAAVDDPAARAAMIEARKPHVETWLNRFSDLGLPLVRVKPFAKKTIDAGWQKTTQTDWPLIEQHVTGTGNPGFVLGQDVIGWDADNALGTEAFRAAGLPLFTVSAGSQDPDSRHPGGVHVLWRRPACWPKGITLSCPDNAVRLANGGLVDVLVGPHQMVLPLSVVVTSEGDQPFRVGAYMSASEAGYCGQEQDGWLMAEAEGELPELPMWAWPAELLQYAPAGSVRGEAPAGLEALVGTVAEAVEPEPRAPREPGDGGELTEQIDALPLLDMIEAAGILGTRGGFDSCGDCETWLRNGSSAEKSITVHDGCPQYGHGVHVWTTGIPTLPQGTHSRLDAFIGLSGGDIETDRGRAMQALGLISPSVPAGMYATDLETVAAELEARAAAGETQVEGISAAGAEVIHVELGADGLLQRAQRFRSAAAVMRASALTPEQRGERFTSGQVLGAPVSVLDLVDGDDAGHDADDDEHDTDPVELREEDMVLIPYAGTPPVGLQLMEYPPQPVPAHVQAVEGARTEWRTVLPPIANAHTHRFVRHEWIFSATPGLSQVAAAADAHGVTRWGMLGALLPRVAGTIPPTVRLTPASKVVPTEPGPTSAGTSINLYSVLVSPPGTGKTDTIEIVAALIPGLATMPPGTGEGVLKEFPRAYPDDAEETGEGDGAPQISNLQSEPYPSSRLLQSDEIDVFVGEMMRNGSKTSGWYRSMWMGGEIGNTASEADRRSLIAAHTYRFGILLGAQPDAVAPLFNETGRGTPQRFMWLPAQQTLPRGSYTGRLRVQWPQWLPTAMVPTAGLAIAPVWVHPPAAADAAMRRQRWLAATVNPLAAPRVADRADAIASRHAVLQQLKVAVLLAALDGLAAPQDAHWHAAEAIMEVRRESIHELVAEADRVREEASAVAGHFNGIAHAAANAARDAEREANVARCAATIVRALIRDAEKGKPPRTFAEAKKALSSAKRAGGHSDRALYGDAALAAVLRDPAVANLGTRVQYVGATAAA